MKTYSKTIKMALIVSTMAVSVAFASGINTTQSNQAISYVEGYKTGTNISKALASHGFALNAKEIKMGFEDAINKSKTKLTKKEMADAMQKFKKYAQQA